MALACPLPNQRPLLKERTWTCALAETKLERSLPLIRDHDLKTLFSNCWLNTLDTTVFQHVADEKEQDHAKASPRTWIITGDIAAMWLRDSTNQVNDWSSLYRLVLGLVYAQAECVLFHPFSNAFIPPTSPVRPNNSDRVHPPPPSSTRRPQDAPGEEPTLRVWESKWELDSLCSFFDLSARLALASGRSDFVHDSNWRKATKLALSICRLQQRGTAEEVELLQQQAQWKAADSSREHEWPCPDQKDDSRYQGADGVYRFQRPTSTASETRALSGLGEPARRCGLVKSAFRPSDDVTVLPFLVPSNCYLVASLRRLAHVLHGIIQTQDSFEHPIDRNVRQELSALRMAMEALSKEVDDAINDHAVIEVINEGKKERVLAYEVDGFGSYVLADDANLPSLLSLPILGYCSAHDPLYTSTRSLVLSPRNKYYFSGSAGCGIGGMHIGLDYIWPMSIIARALTSDEDEEILSCLDLLKSTTARTGLMHESFYKNDASRFTRSWFAWTNGLFGQLVLHLLKTNPHLLS